MKIVSDEDSESPIHNIAHKQINDFKSINKNTEGDDSSSEVYEAIIFDAMFPDKNYYVTNELDGYIYKIDDDGNAGSKIGKYVNRKPILI